MFRPEYLCYKIFALTFFPPLRESPHWGHALHIIGASRSYSDTPQSVELLWTINHSDPENIT
jgi:hypothetical protein